MVGIAILWEFMSEARLGLQPEGFCNELYNSAQWRKGENKYLMSIVLPIVVRVLCLAKHIMSLLANSLYCLTERFDLGSWETCGL